MNRTRTLLVLAILLGSHSEAVAAVLALFLGGLSLGYALFGHVSRRVIERGGSLLLVYGVVESAIGLIALLFPWLFAGIRALSLTLPHASPMLGFAIDVGLGHVSVQDFVQARLGIETELVDSLRPRDLVGIIVRSRAASHEHDQAHRRSNHKTHSCVNGVAR